MSAPTDSDTDIALRSYGRLHEDRNWPNPTFCGISACVGSLMTSGLVMLAARLSESAPSRTLGDKGRRNRKLPRSRTSVIPAVPPTLLHALLLHTLLLPLEQAPVDIAMQDPPPGCRRQALALGRIGAIAGIAEVPTLEAPSVLAW